MSQIVVSETTSNVSTVDSTNTYLVESSGILNILSGGVVSGLITVESNGQLLDVSSGGTTLNAVVSAGREAVFGLAVSTTLVYPGEQDVYSGGIASATTVSGDALQFVYGLAVSTTVVDNGAQFVESGGTAISTTFNGSGGVAYGFVASGGGSAIVSDTTIYFDGTQHVGYSGGSGTAISTTIYSGGWQEVGDSFGTGTAVDTTISSGGYQFIGVNSGGTGSASVTAIDSGGTQFVGDWYGSGTATSTTISGGAQFVGYDATGSVDSTTIVNGGT